MTAQDRRPVGRVRFMDAQRVNLDGFAVEDVELGLVAMRSPHDPEPGLLIRDGRVALVDNSGEADATLEVTIVRDSRDNAANREDDVGLGVRTDGIHHALVKEGIGLVNAGSVDEHNLGAGQVENALDGGTGGLGA